MMDVKMPTQQEVIQEALEILEKHMEPSKIALLVSMLPVGEGDYLAIREKLFPGETLTAIVDKIKDQQRLKGESQNP